MIDAMGWFLIFFIFYVFVSIWVLTNTLEKILKVLSEMIEDKGK